MAAIVYPRSMRGFFLLLVLLADQAFSQPADSIPNLPIETIWNYKIINDDGTNTTVNELLKTDSICTVVLLSVPFCGPCFDLIGSVFALNKSRLILVDVALKGYQPASYWPLVKKYFPIHKARFGKSAFPTNDMSRKEAWAGLKTYIDPDATMSIKFNIRKWPYVYVIKNMKTVYFHNNLTPGEVVKVIEGLPIH